MYVEQKQFRDLANPTSAFERIFSEALESCVIDLTDAPWFIREREVVNLFVFRHLLPRFQMEGLDISQIGIEIPVRVSPETDGHKPGVYGDIIVWMHAKATVWRTCKPLARIEWKHASCREKTLTSLMKGHKKDIAHLERNAHLATLNYAVTTSRQSGVLELSCKRIVQSAETEEFMTLKIIDATGDETGYQGPVRTLISRDQTCPNCDA
jgi:hypothetical protein